MGSSFMSLFGFRYQMGYIQRNFNFYIKKYYVWGLTCDYEHTIPCVNVASETLKSKSKIIKTILFINIKQIRWGHAWCQTKLSSYFIRNFLTN